MIELHHTQL